MPLPIILALNVLQSAGVRAANVILILFAVKLGAEPFTIGFLAAMFSLFPMLLAVRAGKLADRFGPYWLLVFGTCAVGSGALMPYFFPVLPAIFYAAAMSGMLVVNYNVSLQNLVGLQSTPQTRARNFSRYGLAGSIGDLLGPLIAGFTIDLTGHGNACLYLALCWLAPLAIIIIRGNTGRTSAQASKRAIGGLRSLLAEPGVGRTLAISSLANTASNLYQIYLPVYAHSVGLSASTIGVLLALTSSAQFVVQLVVASLVARFREEIVLANTLFAAAASLMLIPFVSSAMLLGLISFAFGLATGCNGPVVNMLMFSNAPKGRSGEALGLKITVNHLTKMIGPVAFGALGSAVGLPLMFWFNAMMLVSGGALSRLYKSG